MDEFGEGIDDGGDVPPLDDADFPDMEAEGMIYTEFEDDAGDLEGAGYIPEDTDLVSDDELNELSFETEEPLGGEDEFPDMPLGDVEPLEDDEVLDAGEVAEDAEDIGPAEDVDPLETDELTEDIESTIESDEVLDAGELIEGDGILDTNEPVEDIEPLEEIEPDEDAEPVEDVELLEDIEPDRDTEPFETDGAGEGDESFEGDEILNADDDIGTLEDDEPGEEGEPLEDGESVEADGPLVDEMPEGDEAIEDTSADDIPEDGSGGLPSYVSLDEDAPEMADDDEISEEIEPTEEIPVEELETGEELDEGIGPDRGSVGGPSEGVETVEEAGEGLEPASDSTEGLEPSGDSAESVEATEELELSDGSGENLELIEELTPQQQALSDMAEYMYAHDYGRWDYAEYSRDPEWQRLNEALINADAEATGDAAMEPVDEAANSNEGNVSNDGAFTGDWQRDGAEPGAVPDETGSTDSVVNPNVAEGIEGTVEMSDSEALSSGISDEFPDMPVEGGLPQNEIQEPVEELTPQQQALSDMAEYMYAHDYGRWDYAEYSRDPEWQRLNEALINADAGGTASSLEKGPVPLDTQGPTEQIAFEPLDVAGNDEYPKPIEPTEPTEPVAAVGDVPPAEVIETVEEPEDAVTELQKLVSEDMDADAFHEIASKKFPEYFENGEFLEQGLNRFGYRGTCGETTVANSLNKVLDTTKYTEDGVLEEAIAYGLCDTKSINPDDLGGTGIYQLVNLYDELSEKTDGAFSVELYEKDNRLSIQEMAKRLDEGGVLSVTVDSCALWGEPRDYYDENGVRQDNFYSDHWIAVTDVERDARGQIKGFDILDSGGGRTKLSASELELVCFGTDEHRVLDPACIVISKNPAKNKTE